MQIHHGLQEIPMNFKTGIVIMFTAICLLSGCETTTRPPDINSLQPTPQEQNQAKLQAAMQS